MTLVGPLIGRGSLHLLDFGDYPQGPHPPFAPSAFGFPPGITNRSSGRRLVVLDVPKCPLGTPASSAFRRCGPACVHRFRPALSRAHDGHRGGHGVVHREPVHIRTDGKWPDICSDGVFAPAGHSWRWCPASQLAGRDRGPRRSYLHPCRTVSVHYLFIGGLLLMVVVSGHLVLGQGRVVRACAGIAGSAALLNMYWLIPAARDSRTMQSHVTHLDLSAFQTMGDPVWGLAVNVAGLYGFWRPGAPLVKNHISGWPFLLLAILIVVGYGLYELYARGGTGGRALALACAGLCIAGGLLAVGAQGPTGGIYVWLFDHLPGFKVMREAREVLIPDCSGIRLAMAWVPMLPPNAGPEPVEGVVRVLYRGHGTMSNGRLRLYRYNYM